MTAPPAATIAPASAAVQPGNPWLQGVKRVAMPLLAFAPFLVDALMQAVNAGTVTIPKEWAGAWAVLVLAVQLYNKARLEQQRQREAAALAGQGLPVGVPLSPRTLERALFTDDTLPTPTP